MYWWTFITLISILVLSTPRAGRLPIVDRSIPLSVIVSVYIIILTLFTILLFPRPSSRVTTFYGHSSQFEIWTLVLCLKGKTFFSDSASHDWPFYLIPLFSLRWTKSCRTSKCHWNTLETLDPRSPFTFFHPWPVLSTGHSDPVLFFDHESMGLGPNGFCWF